MASATRLLIRNGKSAASLLLRARTAKLTEAVQNTGPAIRSLLRLNQTPAIQYPVFTETFPVMQSGFRVGGLIQKRTFGKMEAGQGKEVVDKESNGDSEEEDETDFDDEEIDDIDEDEDFEDSEEDDVGDDEKDKYTRKMKK
ncbi:hypothetical protein AALP_AA3G172600 [Arabis alpina]|uniref:Uncharacterized protein n=1 Tax=Arabis alpina TaxID=50452 RepID=A0A087H9S5_ARAAL|nr:hypothetical protein AALP_AA3G172600 [Arabis alpina]